MQVYDELIKRGDQEANAAHVYKACCLYALG